MDEMPQSIRALECFMEETRQSIHALELFMDETSQSIHASECFMDEMPQSIRAPEHSMDEMPQSIHAPECFMDSSSRSIGVPERSMEKAALSIAADTIRTAASRGETRSQAVQRMLSRPPTAMPPAFPRMSTCIPLEKPHRTLRSVENSMPGEALPEPCRGMTKPSPGSA